MLGDVVGGHQRFSVLELIKVSFLVRFSPNGLIILPILTAVKGHRILNCGDLLQDRVALGEPSHRRV